MTQDCAIDNIRLHKKPWRISATHHDLFQAVSYEISELKQKGSINLIPL